MAKTGLMGGMARPQPQPQPMAQPQAGGGGLAGLLQRGQGVLPARGSQAQYDMVQALLQSGMSDARNSGSPLLAFLAPLAGGAIGTRTENAYQAAQEQRRSETMDQLLAAMGGDAGRIGEDRLRTLVGLMSDESTPTGVRSIASDILGRAMRPQGGGTAQYRAATPEEAALYGATAGQIGPNGRFYPSGGSSPDDAGLWRQQNAAAETISGVVSDMVMTGQADSREDAMALLARDPIFSPQLRMLGINPDDLARQGAMGGQAAAPQAPSLLDLLRPSSGGAQPDDNSDPLGIR